MESPEISVLMCTYNSQKYIGETIKSILNQTFSEFELIIIDDGSKDDTGKVVDSFKDKRIRYYKLKENVGIGKASNFGLSKVLGKYIARADSDDLYDRTRFEKQKKFLDKNKEFCMVGTLIEYFADNENSPRYKSCKAYIESQTNSVISYDDMNEKLYWFCCLINSTTMFRRNLIKKFKYGNYKTGEDYKLFYNLNKRGYKIANIKEKLTKVRIHDDSITATMVKEAFEVLYNIKKEEIDKLTSNGQKTYIWGAGGSGKRVFELLSKYKYTVNGFIDKSVNKVGKSMYDFVIKSPDEILIGEEKVNIIIASEVGRFEIVNYLKNMHYTHLKNFLVF
ncbi:glycosyltransferase [Clostridium felsineum]|uniref:glycosyltransferase n=1 Tax=Clostridium felsineum TaxID=36839 RepID=UPI0009CEBA8D|nr:glycosyltransferase [Clostridium felsineum]URZ00945.1 hypothetical protein CLAUR_009330 [Clostridium felsineum]